MHRIHRCHGPGLYPHSDGCRAALLIPVPPDMEDEEEQEEHCIELAEALDGWYRGLFCPDCAGVAACADEAENQPLDLDPRDP